MSLKEESMKRNAIPVMDDNRFVKKSLFVDMINLGLFEFKV